MWSVLAMIRRRRRTKHCGGSRSQAHGSGCSATRTPCGRWDSRRRRVRHRGWYCVCWRRDRCSRARMPRYFTTPCRQMAPPGDWTCRSDVHARCHPLPESRSFPMKKGFKRETPPAPPAVIKPEPIALLTPLKTLPPEGKSPWLVIIGVVVIGMILGIVVVSYASGARTFTGAGSIMPVVGIGGIGMMMFGGRMFGGGSGQQMTRGKLDALRARFLRVLDELRERIDDAADNLDVKYPRYYPPVHTLAAAAGGPLMWSRSPSGADSWFGVVRVGVGMTSLVEGGAVTFTEPTDMPTEPEMEPATGTALEEFVRAQSVAYGTPALLSLLVEPGYRL